MTTAIGIEERPFRIEVTQTPPQSASPNSRAHFMARYQDVQGPRGFAQAVYVEAVRERNRRPDFKPFRKARIDLTFVFKHRRERDPDNCLASMKTAIDYLVRAGILEKDDGDHVEYGPVKIDSDWHTGPLTIIEITELEESR